MNSLDVAKQSARGSIILFAGNFTATVLAAVTSIVVARLLGPEDFGLFSLALVVPTLLQSFTHFGTRTAVTRYVSYHISIGETEKASRYAQAAILFSLFAGVMFTIVSFASASWVSSVLLHRPALQPYVALASLTIFGQSLLLTGIAASTGWNSMGRASLSNIVQAGMKLMCSPILIIMGFGVSGAVIGHAASFLLAGATSVGLLYAHKVKIGFRSLAPIISDVKEMIGFGFLPFIGSILTGLSIFFVSVLLALVANNANVGYYQAATSMIIPISLLTTATASALYPAFASLHGTRGDTRSAFRMSVKYVGYLIVPSVFLLAATAPDLVDLIYGSSFSPAGNFLIMLSLAYTPIILGQTIIPNFFNGVGLTRLTLCVTGGGALVIFSLAPLFSVGLDLGIPGLIYSIFVSNCIIAGVGLLLVVRRRLGSVDFRSVLAVLVSSAVGLAVCWSLAPFGSHLLNFMFELLIFAIIYLTLAPIFGAMGPDDLATIAKSVDGIPLVGKILLMVLSYERRLASIGFSRTR